jgi:hypothetical protein
VRRPLKAVSAEWHLDLKKTVKMENLGSYPTCPNSSKKRDLRAIRPQHLRLYRMRLTVICRSTRPAKIQSAHLLIEGVDVMRGIQQGFGTDFGYTPLKGSPQTLGVSLIPFSPPNSPEGYVLSRDDVCRFFYPLPMPPTTLALRAKPEQVSVGVRFFDDTEQTLLTGREVQDVLDSVYQVYKEKPGHVNVPVTIKVRVKSTTLPKVDMQGKCNPNNAPMVQPDPPDRAKAEDG